MNLKRFICGLLVVLFVLSMVGCGTSGASAKAPIQLVPQAANLVAQIQLAKLLNDQDLVNAYNQSNKGTDQPQTAQQGLEKLTQETGLNLKDFSQVLLFGDSGKMQESDPGYLGIIAQGNFDATQFIQNIENKTGKKLESSDYNKYTLYTSTQEKFSIAFIGSSTLIFGTLQAVKDSIDVQNGTIKSISGPILDTYNRLGDAVLKAALAVPANKPGALEQGLPTGLPISTDVISKMDLVGFTFNKVSENITLKVDLHFLDTTAAKDGKDTISGAITLFKGLTKDASAKDLLGKIQVAASDLSITISLTTTLDEVQKMTDTLQTK